MSQSANTEQMSTMNHIWESNDTYHYEDEQHYGVYSPSGEADMKASRNSKELQQL